MSNPSQPIAARLNDLLLVAGLDRLDDATAARFVDYFALLLRWNARMNLSAIRDEEGILSRHFVESIACARALPAGIATLVDFGSGAGFPGIPIALCRPEIAVTLAESQGKKAAFLREAARTLGISARVYQGRAEQIASLFDCVTLRAVDQMPRAVESASRLIAPGGWLAVMTTESELEGLLVASGASFSWAEPVLLPWSDSRVLAVGQRQDSLPN